MKNLNESDFEVEEHSIFHDAGPDGCHKALVVEVRKVLTLAPRNRKRKIRRAHKKSRGRLETYQMASRLKPPTNGRLECSK